MNQIFKDNIKSSHTAIYNPDTCLKNFNLY